MPNLNLGNATDFAKLTMSSAGSLLQLFTGRGNSAWDIQEGAFFHDPQNKVLFHVFESATDYNAAVETINDAGGRRKAKHLFPYTDGQLTEDLGRSPDTFDINILLFGDRYLAAFNRLMQELNDPSPGTLQHPVRGTITCVMESYQITHESRSRKALALRITFIEHSFNGFFDRPMKDPSAPGALQKLAESFKKIDNVINKVEATLLAVRTVKNTIKQALTEYKNFYARIGNNMNASFNPGGNIPALLPVQDGGIQLDDGSFLTGGITSVVSPNDPFASLPPEFTDSATAQILNTEQIFKDITLARQNVNDIILQLEGLGNGQGSLEFFLELLDLKQTAIDMQDAFEKGKQSSNVKLIEYVVPRVMSVREVAFANRIAIDNVGEIVILNPELESSNYIPPGTRLKLAVT